MNLQNLVDLALKGEKTKIEAKTVALTSKGFLEPNPISIAQELAALANASGGHLVLGVDSERHRLVGIAPADLQDIIKKLDGILFNNVRPPLYFCELDFGTVVDSDGNTHEIIVIEIPKSLFIHDVDGVTWIRVGTSKQKLDADARARLAMQRSHSKLMHFDELPVPRCAMADLDTAAVKQLLVSSRVANLRSLRLTDERNGEPVPVVATVLLLTERPSDWLRGAYVQTEVFRGTSKVPENQVDAKRFEGSLETQLLDAWAFCKRHSRVRTLKDPARLDVPEYDEIALFEALANAVVHRDYSISGSPILVSMFDDRMEIVSPGGLPNTMTLESMRSLPMARNELLVGILSRYYKTTHLGAERFLIEGRLFGVQQILERSKALSGREPTYELIDTLAVKLTIYPAHAIDVEGAD